MKFKKKRGGGTVNKVFWKDTILFGRSMCYLNARLILSFVQYCSDKQRTWKFATNEHTHNLLASKDSWAFRRLIFACSLKTPLLFRTVKKQHDRHIGLVHRTNIDSNNERNRQCEGYQKDKHIEIMRSTNIGSTIQLKLW